MTIKGNMIQLPEGIFSPVTGKSMGRKRGGRENLRAVMLLTEKEFENASSPQDYPEGRKAAAPGEIFLC